jgi:hypothetical protein
MAAAATKTDFSVTPMPEKKTKTQNIWSAMTSYDIYFRFFAVDITYNI